MLILYSLMKFEILYLLPSLPTNYTYNVFPMGHIITLKTNVIAWKNTTRY